MFIDACVFMLAPEAVTMSTGTNPFMPIWSHKVVIGPAYRFPDGLEPI